MLSSWGKQRDRINCTVKWTAGWETAKVGDWEIVETGLVSMYIRHYYCVQYRQQRQRPDQTRPDKGRGNCPDRGKLQGSSWQALSNGQTGSVIAVKKEDGRTADRGRKGQTLTCCAVLVVVEMPSLGANSSNKRRRKKGVAAAWVRRQGSFGGAKTP